MLRDAGETPRNDLVTGIARTLGWGRTGANIQRRLNEALDHLLAIGEIAQADGYLDLAF